ncbi:MAG TPA: heparan-alpha-glucosaminide N-acetyltransferase [Methanocorpusculum sp.]|nr:heparan-alpha-glucosaminide N-acetyltransferase [Methanocorpusculum sp.]
MTENAVPDQVKTEEHHTGERYWELDAARGMAIVGMLVFHFIATLVMFHIIQETDDFLKYYNTYIFGSAVFVVLAGMSMVLRHERMRVKGKTNREYYIALVKRALLLFAIAMAITLVTWIAGNLFLNGSFIKFGFLHMLAIAMLIAIPLLRFRKWNLIFGLGIITIGLLLIPNFAEPEWLFPLGIHGPEFMAHAMDYFPIFPWVGVLLLGVGIGNIFYPNGIRGFKLPYTPKIVLRTFAKLGNGMVTLFIYLVHMPVFIAALWIFSALTGIGYL